MCPPTRKVLIRAYRGHGLLAWLIRLQTRSPYAHVAMQFGNAIVEAYPGCGVRSRYVADPDYESDVFSLEVSEQAVRADGRLGHVARRRPLRLAGRLAVRVATAGAGGTISGSVPSLRSRRLQAVGIKLLAETEPWEVSPGLLVRSPLLTREAKTC